ncbi:MAG: zinc finger Ran-binding domain-containing protein [Candidatus Thermoplasmatota archaeon]|nr:zinc finger Ran-binding domain-containing protein [Candidatus Thermoplasmatota archaeon]
MAEAKNEFNAWFLLASPILIFIALDKLIPAIGDTLVTDFVSTIVYYGISISIGIFLFRRSRIIKDHEWYRRKSIKKLQRDYAAEDRGVWSRADLAMSELEADAQDVEQGKLSKRALEKLDGTVSALTAEKQAEEIEAREEDHDDVALFSESEHVRRSTARVTGESGPVESVQGTTHVREEPEKGLISGVLDRLKDSTTPVVAESTEPQPSPSNDWYAQEMAGTSMQESDVEQQISPSSVSGKRCHACGNVNSAEESYCENCGEML